MNSMFILRQYCPALSYIFYLFEICFFNVTNTAKIKYKLGILDIALEENRTFIKILSGGFRLIQYLTGFPSPLEVTPVPDWSNYET